MNDLSNKEKPCWISHRHKNNIQMKNENFSLFPTYQTYQRQKILVPPS